MDANRFDTLARSLTDRRSRRGALAAALAGGLGLASLAETDAKKKCPPCKKRKQGKCKKKLPDGTTCPGGSCQGGSCVAATPSTCTDGTKNGSETDIDCGGPRCPRCAINQTCADKRDCTTAYCANGQCQACTTGSSQCGAEPRGTCLCSGGVCLGVPHVVTSPQACESCPEGTVRCFAFQGGANCHKLCGAA
jgi:hypothetical protein